MDWIYGTGVGALVAEMMRQAENDANPIGTRRTAAAHPPMSGEVSIDGLPGIWFVHRKWLEGQVWMHDIERTC